MRDAFRDTCWVEDLGHPGKLLRLNIGYDWCAEHEYGVKHLQEAFQIDTSKLGIEGMRAHATPPIVSFVKRTVAPYDKRRLGIDGKASWKNLTHEERLNIRHEAGLFVSARKPYDLAPYDKADFYMKKVIPGYRRVPYSTSSDTRNNIACQWSDTEFFVWVRGREGVKRLAELHKAILAGDAVLNIVLGNSFTKKAGLSVGIYSRFSYEFKHAILNQAESHKPADEELTPSP